MSGMFANCTNLNTIYVFDTFVTTNVDNGTNMFKNCSALIGGNGTTWSEDHVDHTYARIDTLESPGYFTDIADKPAN